MSENIKHCKCKHEFQDKEHGQGQRVHNPLAKGKGCRCSVCGNEKAEKQAK